VPTSGLSRFALRVENREVPLPLGDFQIGRNRACHLVLHDGMISRRHAVLHVTEEGVTVEDLGSRNGVRVNGIPISEVREVSHGERIEVGSYELLLFEQERRRDERRPTRPVAGRRERHKTPSASFEDETEVDTRSVYDVLLESSEQALAEGRLSDLENSARNLRTSLRSGLLRSQPPEAEVMRRLMNFALQVAEVAGERAWLETLFELHAHTKQMMDAEAVRRVRRLAEQQGFEDNEAFISYVQQMREHAGSLSESERERCERLAELLQQR
jgi:pSer/pThr/pTyr-binding forkhead associated (FHA) protein